MTPEKIEEVLLNPDVIIRLATELKEERQKVLELKPKADFYPKRRKALFLAWGCKATV